MQEVETKLLPNSEPPSGFPWHPRSHTRAELPVLWTFSGGTQPAPPLPPVALLCLPGAGGTASVSPTL